MVAPLIANERQQIRAIVVTALRQWVMQAHARRREAGSSGEDSVKAGGGDALVSKETLPGDDVNAKREQAGRHSVLWADVGRRAC